MLKSLHLPGPVAALVLPGAVEAVHESCDDAHDGGDNGRNPAGVVFRSFLGLEDEWAEEVAWKEPVRVEDGEVERTRLPRQYPTNMPDELTERLV